jgi:hypothetical protein
MHAQLRHDQQRWIDSFDRALAAALTQNVLPQGQDVAG